MKRRIAVLLSILVVVSSICFLGCNDKNEQAKNVYDISATYDANAHELTVSQKVKYYNTSPIEINEALFNLFASAYRQNAKFAPVSVSETSVAYPNGKSYGGISVTEVKANGEEVDVHITGEDENLLSVPLKKGLLPNDSATIEMKYVVTIPNMRHRLGYYENVINLGNWYPVACAYTKNGYATNPYYYNGDPFCFETCDVNLNLTYPSNLVAVSSGNGKITTDGDVSTIAINVKRARDVAVVLGNFNVETLKVGKVDVNYYYYNDVEPNLSVLAAADSIKFFSQKFGAYPYSCYNVVQTAFNQGGMEYSGLCYVSDLYTADRYREIIIHETAHQWWYMLIGNDQTREAWLDEALAEYSTTLFYENHPEYNVSYADRIADAMNAYVLYVELNEPDDTSMNRILCDYETSLDYSYNVYVKGELMLDALRCAIGIDNVYKALADYVKGYEYKIATADALIGCFEKRAGCSLKNFFTSWLDGKILLYGGIN